MRRLHLGLTNRQLSDSSRHQAHRYATSRLHQASTEMALFAYLTFYAEGYLKYARMRRKLRVIMPPLS